MPLRYHEFYQLQVYGDYFISSKSRSHRSAAIMALWPSPSGRITSRRCNEEDIRIGVIQFFILHNPIITGASDHPYLLAKVKWYEDHPRKNWFKNSVILSTTIFSAESEASFIPVSRIMSRCATAKESITFDYGIDNVTVGLPLTRRQDE